MLEQQSTDRCRLSSASRRRSNLSSVVLNLVLLVCYIVHVLFLSCISISALS